ncbi:MAG TPA: tyrosine-type recombinase/integrase, partial [Nitrospira sp.]
AIETGLRQSEQFSLEWKWVDLNHSILTLPMSKSGQTRHVPLSEGAKTLLRSFESLLSSPYVFPSVRDPLQPLCPVRSCAISIAQRFARRGFKGRVGTVCDIPARADESWPESICFP